MAKQGQEVRGTVRGFPFWVLQEYKKAAGKEDGPALEYLLERWANLDPEAERYGISLKAYRQETQGAEIVNLSEKKRSKPASTSDGAS